MPRKLDKQESKSIWQLMLKRLLPLEFDNLRYPEDCPLFWVESSDYPTGYGNYVVVTSRPVANDDFIQVIRHVMEYFGENSCYFLRKEGSEKDFKEGVDWEIFLHEFASSTLLELSKKLEYYLYSIKDNWLIYFHHEGFAFCGGINNFMDVFNNELSTRKIKVLPVYLRSTSR